MLYRKEIRGIIDNESGSAIVLLSLAMVVLVGVMALVADVGVNYVKQTQLSVAADAAALAGGTKLNLGNSYAQEAATEIAVKNGISLENLTVDVDEDGKGITVKTRGPIQTFFGIVFNNVGGQMEQLARVAMTRPIAFFDVFPLGVPEEVELDYSKRVNLFAKNNLGKSNYGVLTFKDEEGKYMTGASIFNNFLKTGYPGKTSIGDIVLAKGGVNDDPFKDGVQYRFDEAAKTHICSLGNCPNDCPRIIILPIYKVFAKDEVEIVDFAAFWIDALPVGEGSEMELWGHFIRPHVSPAASAEGESAYGMTSIKLVK